LGFRARVRKDRVRARLRVRVTSALAHGSALAS
jgi:hypothetical protein